MELYNQQALFYLPSVRPEQSKTGQSHHLLFSPFLSASLPRQQRLMASSCYSTTQHFPWPPSVLYIYNFLQHPVIAASVWKGMSERENVCACDSTFQAVSEYVVLGVCVYAWHQLLGVCVYVWCQVSVPQSRSLLLVVIFFTHATERGGSPFGWGRGGWSGVKPARGGRRGTRQRQLPGGTVTRWPVGW